MLSYIASETSASAVGAPARQVLFVARGPVGRAHHAHICLAAGAVVVAHLDRTAKSAPLRPVEHGVDRRHAITRGIAKQFAIVHARRAHDLARVEQPGGVEAILDLLEGAQHARAEHALVKFRARQPVAMLTRVRAPVLLDDGQRLFHDGAHLFRPAVVLHVENRAHVQAADRGMRVPGAGGAVFFENPGQAIGVLGEVLQPYRAILDKGYRFAVALHRHHDVEPGLAHLPHRRLETGVERLDDRAGKAEVGHQFTQLRELLQLRLALVAGKLDQQQRIWLAAHETIDGLAKQRNLARQIDHGAIDQFDRGRVEPDDMLGRVHRLVKAREMANAQHLVPRDLLQLQLQAGKKRQRAFRTDQQARDVGLVGLRDLVDVVTADATQQRRKTAFYLLRLALAELDHFTHQAGTASLQRTVRRVGEVRAAAVRQDGVDGLHVVHHVAVANRARAATVVAGHAAEGGAIPGGDVDRIEKPMWPEVAVELVEHHSGLDANRARLGIEGFHLVQVLAGIDHQRLAHRLTYLRSAAAPRQYRDSLVGGDLDRTQDILFAARHHYPDRFDLVNRRVGTVAAAAEGIEQHLALEFATQARRQRAIADTRRGARRALSSIAANRHRSNFLSRGRRIEPSRRVECNAAPT
jgi:hypothetical protein